MTNITTPCGWQFDTVARTMAWPEVHGDKTFPWPEVSLASQAYFGANYLASQAASRTTGDAFRKAWADEAEGRKAKDAPKSAVPASDSPEYLTALLTARKDLFDKLVEGYEVGARDSVDPVAEETDKLGRKWLQAFASVKGWYVLPAKKKVAVDADAYADPKGRYATFGDALAAFVASTADSTLFAMKGQDGKAWPAKTRKGVSIADLIAGEAARIVAERTPKAAATLAAEGGDDVDF